MIRSQCIISRSRLFSFNTRVLNNSLKSNGSILNQFKKYPIYKTTRSIYVPSRQKRESSKTIPTSDIPSFSNTSNSTNDTSSTPFNSTGIADAFITPVPTENGVDDSIVQRLQSLDLNRTEHSARKFQKSQGRKTRKNMRRNTSLGHTQASELERKILEVERYTEALEQHIRENDEAALLQKKMKEAEEKYGKLDDTSRPQTENLLGAGETQIQAARSGEETKTLDKAADDILDFLDLPEPEVQSQLGELKKGPEGMSSQQVSKVKQSLFLSPAPSITLSDNILQRIGSSIASIASEKAQNWIPVIERLYNTHGLVGVPAEEVSLLIKQIPLDQRAPLMPIIHEMIWDAEIPFTKLIYDNIIAAYSHVGNTNLVKIFMDEMKQKDIKPDHYTYGNLIKSYSKNKNLAEAIKTIKEMQRENVQLSLPIYNILINACISSGEYDQAFQVFDMLKFLGTNTLPDVQIYNTIMVAALKQRNIHKVLDLYQEMTTRSINPLQPDESTYTVLIQACAQDKLMHLRAWQFLLELHEKDLAKTRHSLNAMLLLCGQTGELSFARSIFWQMCSEPVSYPDSFSLGCLFKAYANYKPGAISPVLSTAIGSKLRAAVFFNLNMTGSSQANDLSPPFLPYPVLANKLQAMAESRAIFQFFKDLQHPRADDLDMQQQSERLRWIISPVHGKVNFINEKTIVPYLEIPINLDNHKELMFRWKTATCIEMNKAKRITEQKQYQIEHPNNGEVSEEPGKPVVQIVAESPDTSIDPTISKDPMYMNRVPRSSYMYDLMISGHTKNKWPYDQAKGIWESRGEWRRNVLSVYRQSLTIDQRKKSDFMFARHMVKYLAYSSKLQDALDLVYSSIKLFKWKKSHLYPIIEMAQQIEDTNTIKAVHGIVNSYKEK